MSLYNALFGKNKYGNALLAILGLTESDVPRFRDCYLDEKGRIVIYTRTGGGNRKAHDSEELCRESYPEYFDGGEDDPSGPWNSDLRAVPGFLFDKDDDFDCTYASFYFNPPEGFNDALKEIWNGQGEYDPSGAFAALIAAMQSGENTPETRKAEEIGKRIFGAIERGESKIEI